ncbi:MAG: class II fructose-bisphosphate aldolase [Candidatus Atribacteria bacterium]|nr:class II fructose-bisphosphate aldolase [Candidatus Atribacteria bacterium]
MPLVAFSELMKDAEKKGYAVGYFESWNMESLFAVADAAEATRSPVILGFSGMSLPDAKRLVQDNLAVYAQMGLSLIRGLTVPATLLFNESPYLDWVERAMDVGFNMVMYTDDRLQYFALEEQVRKVVRNAHQKSVAVEGELNALPGIENELHDLPGELHLTDPQVAARFVESTGVDALSVNIGQVHLHGRRRVPLNFTRLRELREVVPIPLVLHGASSVAEDDFAEAIKLGIRKINVGSILKLVVGDEYNPYRVIGSGFSEDVETTARIALQMVVERLLRLFGSAGKA